MRVISGILKGKIIDNPKLLNTRPLRDFVKENIFNIIQHSKLFKFNLENKNILDLYSGMGSFGIECISRGAKKVTFVENNKTSIKFLKKNLTSLSLDNKSIISNDDVIQFVESYKGNKFDMVFLDPPYKDRKYLKLFDFMNIKQICSKKHLIICHRELGESEIKFNHNKVLIKKYGRSKIYFFNL